MEIKKLIEKIRSDIWLPEMGAIRKRNWMKMVTRYKLPVTLIIYMLLYMKVKSKSGVLITR